MASVKGMFRSAHFAATITFAAIQALGFRKLVANFDKSVQRSIGTRGVRPGCRGRDGCQTAVADGIRSGYTGEGNEDNQGQNVETSHLRNCRDGQRSCKHAVFEARRRAPAGSVGCSRGALVHHLEGETSKKAISRYMCIFSFICAWKEAR